MTRSSPALLLSLSLVSLGLVGCGTDAPPPDEVRARISTDLVHVLAEAEAATADGASLPDTSSLAIFGTALGGPLDRLVGTGGSTIPFAVPAKLSRLAALVAPRSGVRTTGDRALHAPAIGDTPDLGGAEAAQWLNDHIFTDANHAGDGIYKIPGTLACEGEDPADVADCARAFDQIQLRIRVSENDELLRFALQIGPNHDEPLAVGLGANLLSLTVDLDELEDVARAMLPKSGADLPRFALGGEATAKLEITGAAAARISLDIDRALSIKVAESGASLDGPDAIRFTSQKATVASLALDGGTRSMEASLGLGKTTAHIPDDAGAIDLDLPGITGIAKFADGQPLRLANLGLGATTTTIQVGGQLALAIDLNPDDGRALDALVSHDLLTSTDLLEVTPRFDLRMTTNHTLLGDEVPVYDVTQLFLDGGLRTTGTDSVAVEGTFRLETNPAGYGVSAVAGQCVSTFEAIDAASDRAYTAWAVAACN